MESARGQATLAPFSVAFVSWKKKKQLFLACCWPAQLSVVILFLCKHNGCVVFLDFVCLFLLFRHGLVERCQLRRGDSCPLERAFQRGEAAVE